MNDIYIIENGKRRKAAMSVCKICNKEFLHRKNRPRPFCSTSCLHESRKKKINVICSNCGKNLHRSISKLKASKHGFHFCDRKCKEAAQKLGGNCPQIRPPHYGIADADSNYRSKMSSELLSGCRCGEKRIYLLLVHHVDGNRSNSNKSNLEVVCGNCHIIRHLKKLNGQWIYCSSSLTSKEDIEKFYGDVAQLGEQLLCKQ